MKSQGSAQAQKLEQQANNRLSKKIKAKDSENLNTIVQKLKNKENLDQIELSNEGLNDENIRELAQNLLNCENKVSFVKLVKNKITDDGFYELLKALQNN